MNDVRGNEPQGIVHRSTRCGRLRMQKTDAVPRTYSESGADKAAGSPSLSSSTVTRGKTLDLQFSRTGQETTTVEAAG